LFSSLLVLPTPLIYSLSLHDALPISSGNTWNLLVVYHGLAVQNDRDITAKQRDVVGLPFSRTPGGIFGRIDEAVKPAHEMALGRSEEHTSELQSPYDLVCRLLLEKKK